LVQLHLTPAAQALREKANSEKRQEETMKQLVYLAITIVTLIGLLSAA
jgi:hypothetical protein